MGCQDADEQNRNRLVRLWSNGRRFNCSGCDWTASMSSAGGWLSSSTPCCTVMDQQYTNPEGSPRTPIDSEAVSRAVAHGLDVCWVAPLSRDYWD